MNVNTIITDKFTFGGNCIGKINGKTVFVPYSIPGEKLEVEITESKKDYDVARITKILEPSKMRQEAVCPLYEKCGGCNMMHIKEEEQRRLKKEVLKDLFEKNGISLSVDEIQILSGKSLGYRCRFKLTEGSLCERKSNNLVDIDFCPVADHNINNWLKETPSEKRPEGKCSIFGWDNLDKKIVVAKAPEKVDFDGKKALAKKKNKNYKEARKIYSGTITNESCEAEITLLGKKISFDARGFFQSNMEVLEKAVKEVISGLKGTKVLDMYSGCGTFSVFLADYFEEVTLVEHNRDAIVYAEKNLAGKNHVSYGLSGAKWVNEIAKTTNPRFDAVVIDPPRSGMEKEVLTWLCNSNIPQIRAVSCDPATQSRDIAHLVKSGYKIQKTFLLDFYPNTSHIESLVVLEKDI